MSTDSPARSRRSIWRRVERRFVGFWISLALWFVERRLLKGDRNRGG